MESCIYIAIFLIGIMFGSFFTLAVYRIPRKESIVFGRSHCTSCNHKLGFWDLIPILSYLFLGGKCRYCGKKIRIRYLLLEVFSGVVFLAIAFTHGVQDLWNLAFIYLFVAGMFIIAGIDKEKWEIPNSVCIYELCIAIGYVIYSFWLRSAIVNHIIGATLIPLVMLLIDKLFFHLYHGEKKVPVGVGDIKYLSLIGLMFGYPIQVISIVVSMMITLLGIIIHRHKEIPYGYYLTIATCLVLVMEPYITDIIELL